MLLLVLAFLALLFLKVFAVVTVGWVIVFIPLMVAGGLWVISQLK